jgi:hypothetical protein
VTIVRPTPQPELAAEPDAAATARVRDRVQLVDRTVAPIY